MEWYDCALCEKRAVVPPGEDGVGRYQWLEEHVRMDVGYTPFRCGYDSCLCLPYPTERIFIQHHDDQHPGLKKVLIDQSDEFLTSQCKLLTVFLFPTAAMAITLEVPPNYLESDDFMRFHDRLKTWTAESRRRVVSRDFYGICKTNQAGGDGTGTSGLGVDTFIDVVDNDLTDLVGDEQDNGERDSGAVENASPKKDKESKLGPPKKKHVYAKYASGGLARKVGSARGGTTKRVESKSLVPATSRGKFLRKRHGRGGQNPRGAASVDAKIDLCVENVARGLVGSLEDKAQGADPNVLVASILQAAVGDPKRAGPKKAIRAKKSVDPRNAKYCRCRQCEIVVKKSSRDKHVDSHLSHLGEWRFKCLVCGMRTMFKDSIQIRHLPPIHGIKQPLVGVHFLDHYKEHGLEEKRSKVFLDCFPPTS